MSNKNNIGRGTPVIQDWVVELSWKDQATLISTIRGIDYDNGMLSKELYEKSKDITRMLRWLILNNADDSTGFMTDKLLEHGEVSKALYVISKLTRDDVSSHWIDHIIKAIKVIFRKHPNPYTKKYYYNIHKQYDILINYGVQVVSDDGLTATIVTSRTTHDNDLALDSDDSDDGLSVSIQPSQVTYGSCVISDDDSDMDSSIEDISQTQDSPDEAILQESPSVCCDAVSQDHPGDATLSPWEKHHMNNELDAEQSKPFTTHSSKLVEEFYNKYGVNLREVNLEWYEIGVNDTNNYSYKVNAIGMWTNERGFVVKLHILNDKGNILWESFDWFDKSILDDRVVMMSVINKIISDSKLLYIKPFESKISELGDILLKKTGYTLEAFKSRITIMALEEYTPPENICLDMRGNVLLRDSTFIITYNKYKTLMMYTDYGETIWSSEDSVVCDDDTLTADIIYNLLFKEQSEEESTPSDPDRLITYANGTPIKFTKLPHPVTCKRIPNTIKLSDLNIEFMRNTGYKLYDLNINIVSSDNIISPKQVTIRVDDSIYIEHKELFLKYDVSIGGRSELESAMFNMVLYTSTYDAIWRGSIPHNLIDGNAEDYLKDKLNSMLDII